MVNSPSNEHIATIYKFCAQSMHYPEPSWLNENFLSSLYKLLEALEGSSEIEKLKIAINESDDFLEDLQVEHTRLFINGVPHVAAPPYGSVYIDKSLQGKYTEDVLMYYHSLGYTITEDADFPDNLIHQLEFLALLAEEENIEAEKEFLSRFFLPWYHVFSQLVKKEYQHPFYYVIINIIDFFTQEEKEYGVQLNEA